jgi:hypothetical protein
MFAVWCKHALSDGSFCCVMLWPVSCTQGDTEAGIIFCLEVFLVSSFCSAVLRLCTVTSDSVHHKCQVII